MRKEKVLSKAELNKKVNSNEKIFIKVKDNQIYFEINEKTTDDISEGVCILMREISYTDPIWKIDISELNLHQNVLPSKALYWLTGGDKEWKNLTNYSIPWCECIDIFESKFGDDIIKYIKISNTLGDLRNYILENLNLPILYEYAFLKKITK